MCVPHRVPRADPVQASPSLINSKLLILLELRILFATAAIARRAEIQLCQLECGVAFIEGGWRPA
jgi:hypothetical protein